MYYMWPDYGVQEKFKAAYDEAFNFPESILLHNMSPILYSKR